MTEATIRMPRVPVVSDTVVYTKKCTPHHGPANVGHLEVHAALVVRARRIESVVAMRGNVPDAYEVNLMVFNHDGDTYFMRGVAFAGTAEPGTDEATGRWAWRPSDERRQVLVEAAT